MTRYDFPTDCNVLFEHFDETKESSNTENRIDCNECQPHSFKIYFFFIDTLRSIVGTNTHNLRIPSREINSIYRIQRAPRMFLFVCTRIVIASIRRNIMNDSIDSNLSKGDFDETERDRENENSNCTNIYILEFYSEKLNRSRIVRYREFRILIYRVYFIELLLFTLFP